jgi:probable F420-dependent oxidoreductase
MAGKRPFRFSAQIDVAPTKREWADKARKAEDMGYSVLTMPDHFGDQLAPAPALMAAADATTTLRIGTLLWCNDYRHPLMLAKEAATLDLLSEGRLELGIGAGWMRSDYEQSGIAYDAASVRIERFEEAIRVLKGLFAEGPFDFDGRHYRITGHDGRPKPVQSPHPPIVVGGGGKRVLSVAAREADIVGINANLREGTGGAETMPDLTPDATSRKLAWVRDAAGERFDDLEINTLIGFAMVTDDAKSIADAMAPGFGITPEEALHVPVCLVGSLDTMADELAWRREHWGISYVTFDEGTWESMGPLIGRVAGT